MGRIKEILTTTLRSLPHSRVAILGVIISVILFPVLVIALILDWQGGISNPYFSFLFYLILGPLFMLGIIMVMLGLFIFTNKGDSGIFSYEYLRDQFSQPDRSSRIRKRIYVTTFLTAVFLFVIGVAAYSSFQYTDSVGFCAKFCHTVMQPEYVTYQNSPHSQIPCVDCHIGESAEWTTRTKISGIKQLFAVAFDAYSQPIETPLNGLRPTRAICEKCHRPDKFHGHKLYFIDRYLPDKTNTHVQTAMIMKVGYGGQLGQAAHGIHWHTSAKDQVVYTHTDPERKNIIKVELIKADGSSIVYNKKGANPEAAAAGEFGVRTMDCMDCHNRPTHIFLSPQEALDKKLFNDQQMVGLPYLKRQALQVINRRYDSAESARAAMEQELKEWYGQHYPDMDADAMALLDNAIRKVQDAYMENVFPEMKIGWNTYEDFIGHANGSGCYRCHDGSFSNAEGKVISRDCNICHLLLAENEPVDRVMSNIGERCM